jgi:hypothetical protein
LYNALKQHALHDYDLASSLNPTKSKFPDWVIIISFYTALHAVNAHAAKKGWKWKRYARSDPFKISRHSQTLRYVSKKLGRGAFKKYTRLYQECWNARYDPFFLKNTLPSDATPLFKLSEEFLRKIPW